MKRDPPLPIRLNRQELERIDRGRIALRVKFGIPVTRSTFIKHAIVAKLDELGVKAVECDTPETAAEKAKAARAAADAALQAVEGANGGHTDA
jgi:hypothetical protein